MRRGLMALAVFAAFIVAVALFRGGPSSLEASATPDGVWDTANCDAIPDGFGLADVREQCLGSDGVARFQLTITNGTEGTVAVTACTVEGADPDGGAFPFSEPVIVPVRSVYGVPYAAAYLEPGSSVSIGWFVPWLGPLVDVSYDATCDWTPFSGPLPL